MRTTWLLAAAFVLAAATACHGSPPQAAHPTAHPTAHRTASPTSVATTVATSHAGSTPVPGWAGDVVRAGRTAYVVGWDAAGAGALWQVDGAGRVSARTAPPGLPGNPGLTTSGRQAELAFADPSTGLALVRVAGGRRHVGHSALFVTTDGARSWAPVDLPGLEQAQRVVVGGGAAYALTSSCTQPAGACDHATLWSVDLTGATAPHTFDSLPARAGTSGLALAAYGRSVWVLLGLGAGRGTALHSTDGGHTWQRSPVDGCLWEAPVATSRDVVWAACGTGMMQHFTRQAGRAAPRPVFSPDIGGTTSSTLLPFTDATAYGVVAGGREARVEATHDGGRTFTTVGTVPVRLTSQGFRIVFVTPEVGYLTTLNGGQLFLTTDAARSWHRIGR